MHLATRNIPMICQLNQNIITINLFISLITIFKFWIALGLNDYIDDKIMLKKQQLQKKFSSKTSYLHSRSSIQSDKSDICLKQVLNTQPSFYQKPKLQNKKLKLYRTTRSSFFNHLSHTKKVQAQQLLDSSFVKFLDNVQKHKGFKGAKTHTWNQLMYLTPQKRHKSSSVQITDVKKELYQIIKAEGQKKIQKWEQLVPVRTTLVQFLTGYNPSKSQNVNEKEEIKQKCRYKRKGVNVIRDKLKNTVKKSEYREKLHNYQMIFQGYKIT